MGDSKSLNVCTEEIFHGRILTFGRHFERVRKIYTRALYARMVQFFLKIDFFGTTHEVGTSPKAKMASRYGLHP